MSQGSDLGSEGLYRAFVAELASGYRYDDSCSSPCKEITGVSMGYYGQEKGEGGEFWVLVDVSAYQQSPWGDTATTVQSFRMKESEIITLVKKLEEGDFKLSSDVWQLAVEGLKNILIVLNENIPAHLASGRRMPDIQRINSAAQKTRDMNIAPLLKEAARIIEALNEQSRQEGAPGSEGFEESYERLCGDRPRKPSGPSVN